MAGAAQSPHWVAGPGLGTYPVLFLDDDGVPITPLNEWYRAWDPLRPSSTREAYAERLRPVLRYFRRTGHAWNGTPAQVRAAVIVYRREELHVRVKEDALDGVVVDLTARTPIAASTLRRTFSALRDLYETLRQPDLALYAHLNPMVSQVRADLAQLRLRAIENAGAPDHAGIRSEERAGRRRVPTAFLRHPAAQEWSPDPRRATADVCRGIHAALDAIDADAAFPRREKAIILVMRSTGAWVGEIVRTTVGGFRAGPAGRLLLTNR
jgi:hypothetical protein